MLYILENVDTEQAEPYLLFPFDSPTKKNSCDMQQLLYPYIFSDLASLSERSMLILLMARLKLPENTVDNTESGVMYTLLYGLTFIFVRIINDLKTPMVKRYLSINS